MLVYDMIMVDVDAGEDAWMLEIYRLQCKKQHHPHPSLQLIDLDSR